MADQKMGMERRVAHITRVAVAFGLVLLWLLMVVITTRQDTLLFSDGTLTLPLLDAEMDYLGFYLGGPFLLVILHAYLLIEHFRLRYSIEGAETSEIFFPGFLLPSRDRRRLPPVVGRMLTVLQYLVAASPLIVLVWVKRLYLPLRLEGPFPVLFDLILWADLLVILVFMTLNWRLGGDSTRRGCLGRLAWAVILFAGTLLASHVWLGQDVECLRNNAAVHLPHWQPDSISPDLMITVSTRNLVGADFSGAYLPAIDFRGANLEGANLHGAHLWGGRMGRQPDRATTLRDANLTGADLRGADLSDADLTRADLTNAKLDGALLNGADLSGVKAHGATFFGADLRKVDLSGADITGADLRLADLRGATMVSTTAVGTELDFARMPSKVNGSDFREAILVGTSGVWLTYVDLREAILDGSPLMYQARTGESRVLGECLVEELDEEDAVERCRSLADEVTAEETDDQEVADDNPQDGEDEEVRRRSQGPVAPAPTADLRGASQELRASDDRVRDARRRLRELSSAAESFGTLAGEAIHRRQGALEAMLAEGEARSVCPRRCLEDLRGWTEGDLAGLTHISLARAIVATACQRPLIADEVLRRALGELPPPARSLQRALARELVLRQKRCSVLREMPDLVDQLCQHWSHEDFCRRDDRVFMQAPAPAGR